MTRVLRGWALTRTLSSPSSVLKLLQSATNRTQQRINQHYSERAVRKRGLTIVNTSQLLAHKQHWDIRTFGEEEDLEVPFPVRVEPPTSFDHSHSGHFLISSPWALRLDGAMVCGPLSTAFSARGEIILESQSSPNNRRAWNVPYTAVRQWHRAVGCNSLPELDVAVPLSGYWARSYFHWMGEHLPRLALLPRLQPELGPVSLLIPKDPPSWLVDSLSLLGYDRKDLIGWPAGHVVRSRQAVVLSSPRVMLPGAPFSLLRPSMLRFVRDALAPAPPTSPDKRLYVSRAHSPGRRVANEAQVRSVLESRGFVAIDPGSMSLSSQIETFAAARTIVGPHGAGLTNALFARKADLIELHELDRPKTASFRLIAAALDHRYGALSCQSLRTLHPRRPDLEVDCDRLAELVDTMDQTRDDT